MEIKYFKSPARLLNRDYFNKGGLDLSKQVLWVSVVQLASKLQAVNVGGLKKNSADRPSTGIAGTNRAIPQNFFDLQL